jgi:exonuclease VII small subunit
MKPEQNFDSPVEQAREIVAAMDVGNFVLEDSLQL